MVETLTAPQTFPAVVGDAVEGAAAAFFRTSCGLAHVPNTDPADDAAGAGIMSTISFVGDIPWAFALAFPEDAAETIAKAFAGFDIPFDSPDMADVVGEIVNVIAGDVVNRLAKAGVTAQMSLPTTVRGSHVAMLVPTGASTTRFTFAGPQGTCWFDLVATPAGDLPATAPSGVEARPAAQPEPPKVSEPAAPPAPVDEVMAAWLAAQEEAERQLAEQDAAEAAARAAGTTATAMSTASATPAAAAPVRGSSRRLVCLTLVFAFGGWGLALGILISGKRAKAPQPEAHAAEPEPAPAAKIDGLIRAGQFEQALRACLDAPKGAMPSPALSVREGLCLEGKGQWLEALGAYQKAEVEGDGAVWAAAVLGQARCAAQDDAADQARAHANRALLRSGHPACRAVPVRDEVRHLFAWLTARRSGVAPARDAGPAAPGALGRTLDWLAIPPSPTAPARDVVEVHRTLDAPNALQATAHLGPRPAVAALRAVATTAGWEVKPTERAAALLERPVGPVNVDHMPLPELLDLLTDGTGGTWAVRDGALHLTAPPGR